MTYDGNDIPKYKSAKKQSPPANGPAGREAEFLGHGWTLLPNKLLPPDGGIWYRLSRRSDMLAATLFFSPNGILNHQQQALRWQL